MTAGQKIELAHEIRMWVVGLVVPSVVTGGMLAITYKDEIKTAINNAKEKRRLKKMFKNVQ